MENLNISTFPKQIKIINKCPAMASVCTGGVNAVVLRELGLLVSAVAL
jgi:hypothetical protein